MKVIWVSLIALVVFLEEKQSECDLEEFWETHYQEIYPDQWDILEVAEGEEKCDGKRSGDHILNEINESNKESKDSGDKLVIEEDHVLVDRRNEEKKIQEPPQSIETFLYMDIT